MIYTSSIVPVLDNSGALLVKCIKIYGKYNRGCASLGSLILISIKTYKTHRKVKQGQLFKCILARTKHNVLRHGGYYVRSELNGVVLLNNRMSPLGTRILGPILKETRRRGFLSILGLAPYII
jgi:large subunit ribosomal protein L14